MSILICLCLYILSEGVFAIHLVSGYISFLLIVFF